MAETEVLTEEYAMLLVTHYVNKPDVTERITNFGCTCEKILRLKTVQGDELHIQLRFCTLVGGEEYTKLCHVAASSIRSFDLSEIDPVFWLASGRSKHRLFENYILSQMADLPSEDKFYIDQLGDTYLDGKYCYALGDKLLGMDCDEEAVLFAPELADYVVEADDGTDRQLAFNTFHSASAVEPDVSVPLCLYEISTLLGGIYARAELPEAGSPLIVGHSQSRKTTLAVTATAFYRHKSNLGFNKLRLDSTQAGISIRMARFRGSTIIIDDNFRGSTRGVAQLSTLQASLRQKADRQERVTAVSSSNNTKTGLVITSESLLRYKSDLARTQVIIVREPINSERLTQAQKDIDLLVAFKVQFVDWVYRNYYDVLQDCDEARKQIESDRVHASRPWQRADDHYAVSKLSAKLYIK